MRALLDVNVLIALFDVDHIHSDRAHAWFSENADLGWASCPLTENGVVRIMSLPGFSAKVRHSPARMSARLTAFAEESDHEFWPDDISLRDSAMFDTTRILGRRQLTDLYLLALAAHHKGRLVTFDSTIVVSAVPIARQENLCVI